MCADKADPETVDQDTARGANWWNRLLPPTPIGRILMVNSAVASVGNGLYMSGAAIYYVRKLDLSPVEVGLAMSVGGAISLLTSVPIGRWSDRIGARESTMIMGALKGLLLIIAALVTNFYGIVAVIVALAIAEAGGSTCRSALISGVMGREGRVRLSAYLRAVFNAGFTLGVAGAGVALVIDTSLAYQSLFWLNSIAMFVVCGLYLRVPRVPPVQKSSHERVKIFDAPYLAVAQVAGLVRLGPVILSVGVPLWLVEHTAAPKPLAAWLIAVNTAIVILFQVAASKGADTVPGAARLQTLALLALAAGCGVSAVAAGASPWLAAVVLFVAVVLYSLGEIWGESARWGLRYELAPDHAQGAYGGLFSTGDAVATIFGPALATSLPDLLGTLGWAILAALFMVGIVFGRIAVNWAARTRPSIDGMGQAA